MFKKGFKTSTNNKLSGKAQNALKQALLLQYDPPVLTKLFSDNKHIHTTKISGTKTIFYLVDNDPVFVQPDVALNFYFPTIFALYRYPSLLPPIIMKQGVEKYILNGANLMWAGVGQYAYLGKCLDKVVSIATSNKIVIGVGIINTISEESFKSGVACKLLHYISDGIMQMGNQKILEKPVYAIIPQIPKQEAKKQVVKE